MFCVRVEGKQSRHSLNAMPKEQDDHIENAGAGELVITICASEAVKCSFSGIGSIEAFRGRAIEAVTPN